MPKELAKNFDLSAEDSIYQQWEQSGFFNPDNLVLPAEALNYTIILPPPNITDKLHMGHSAMLAIQDLFIRYHRMSGFRTLWVPGTDHAAIATQTVVEKKLFKEAGLTRHALGREQFLDKVWEFLNETQTTILHQIRKMGASLDWSRLAFTLDEPRQQAVREMFVKMYNDDLIYRGERIVNWCPRCQSTLADDEVEHEEQQAKLYTFKYDANFPITISTTRPETKLGDTAVAVNPKDERYKQYIGQTFKVDFCGQDLEIKIIADRNVEMDFGTGAVGVTPAHSMIDWQMAEANNLPVVKVIDETAMIRQGFGVYSGLTVLEARNLIVVELEARGLMTEVADIQNNLSVCYRCNTAVEPLPSKQWFVAVDKPLARLGNKSLKQLALAAAETGEIEFIPERFNKKYSDWMRNLKDWCISRQIWFGHEIPVWYRRTAGQPEEVYVGLTAPEGEAWVKDTDTLDTWFSSGMWTFSTLNKPGDLERFHPTQMLETGYEIITLWVSRMVMMSYYAVGTIPFEKVYLHGMTLDKNGKKMSKSKGNGIDPLDMIKLYGTDAVRLALTTGTTPGNDFKFYEEKVAVSRNFVNKLWNVSRFILASEAEVVAIDYDKLSLPDAWILSRLNRVKQEVDVLLTAYDFAAAAELLRVFTWDELADWYLEAVKFDSSSSTPAILRLVLEDVLKLWHPFIPFVTEAIWSSLDKSESLMIAAWPKADEHLINAAIENQFVWLKEIIVAVRNARSENKIEPAKKIKAVIVSPQAEFFAANQKILTSLRTGLESIEFAQTKPENAIFVKTTQADIYLLGTIDPEQELERVTKTIAETSQFIERLGRQLDNAEFTANAPTAIVDKERQKLTEAKERLMALTDHLAKLKSLL